MWIPLFLKRLEKGWTCCKQRETHFDDWLNIKGCTQGHHDHVEKPKQQPKKEQAIDPRFKDVGGKETFSTSQNQLLEGSVIGAPEEKPKGMPLILFVFVI